ncbi:hypothetical protein LEN26_007107 [Aphanomyces euteiches]|uniref:HTH CENPB-type domain-containing protein n=1 Tax=Aphanomyces euteiches TaxID=100861 RepID=A0A6G0XHQ4_9STRA|nr:hypothetical protein Ae201684_004679 [Aphanomyces euteiches]KAH9073238.1 hypothetical protein Ae201684P_015055 [Aphanomyces euteiches]KAH9127372.1 hypothetical protein AeMF1_002324 [Aphanomyces euteiches]KAH9133436.1 hypothetical protein LEN26_007107 [Aphanomyces euteiches]KAH9144765.1 hypothetical protein AeRB84_011301 [Aphanomyces euteiches]
MNDLNDAVVGLAPDDEVAYPDGLNGLDGGFKEDGDDETGDSVGGSTSSLTTGKRGTRGKSSTIKPSPTASVAASSAVTNPAPTNKRKRVVVSLYQKQQVLHRLENGEKPVDIAALLGISRQQISDIKKNKERILRFCGDAKHLASLRRKTLKVADDEAYPAVERELYRWMITEKCHAKPVTHEALHQKAAELLAQVTGSQTTKSDESSPWPGVTTAWMKSFKKRYGIKELAGPMPTYDVEEGAINMGMPLESNEELNLSIMGNVHANLNTLGEMGISMESDNLSATYSQATNAKDLAAKLAGMPLHPSVLLDAIHMLSGRMDALEATTRERIAQLDARIDDIYMLVHPKLKLGKDGANRNAYKVV